MEKIAFVFCFLISDLMASGISLSKIASIPTCPYNQHLYTESVNLPFLLRQALTQQLQPLQSYQPTKNYNPYSQSHIVTTQIKPSQQQPHITPNINQSKANQLNQGYINKVISNPIVQDILNHNIKLKDPVRVGNPVRASNNFGSNTPQVINNYFIVPPEYIKNKENLRIVKRPSEICKTWKDTNSPEGSKRKQPANQNKVNSNKRGNLRKMCEDSKNDSAISESIEQNSVHERRKKNDKGNVNKSNSSPLINRRERGQKKKIVQNKKQSDEENFKTKDEIHNLNNENQALELNKNADINSNGKTKDDDAFEEGFRKRYPNMRENTVKSLLSYLRRQLRKQQRDRSKLKPSTNNSLSFDGSEAHDNKNTTKRHTNRTVSIKYDEHDKILSGSTKNTALDPVDSTKKFDDVENKIYSQEDPDSFEIFETMTHDDVIPDMNSFERIDISTLDNNDPQYVDERMDLLSDTIITKENFGNNEEIHDKQKKFQSNKTYNKSEPQPIIRRQALRNQNNNYHAKNQNVRSNSVNRLRPKYSGDKFKNHPTPSSNSRMSTTYHTETNNIKYRTPPVLERPDFRTRPVIKETDTPNHYKDTNRVFDTFSTYSKTKQPASKEIKYFRKAEKIEDQNTNIETVYGHSKVVKYGNVNEINVDDSTPTVTNYIPDSMQYENDGKSVIVTKRIPPEQFW